MLILLVEKARTKFNTREYSITSPVLHNLSTDYEKVEPKIGMKFYAIEKT